MLCRFAEDIEDVLEFDFDSPVSTVNSDKEEEKNSSFNKDESTNSMV